MGGDLWKQLFVMGKKCESWFKKKSHHQQLKLDSDDDIAVPRSLFQLLVMGLACSVSGFVLSAAFLPHVHMAKGSEEAGSPLLLLRWDVQ